ncbi:MAG: hypothetical protein ACRENK_04970 [Gemmatimonadaceae bacterium]
MKQLKRLIPVPTRTISLFVLACAICTIATGCKKKGGGYFAPAPTPVRTAHVAR